MRRLQFSGAAGRRGCDCIGGAGAQSDTQPRYGIAACVLNGECPGAAEVYGAIIVVMCIASVIEILRGAATVVNTHIRQSG